MTIADESDGCMFCSIKPRRIVAENEWAYAIRDDFPVTPMHTLVIPKRHEASYFELSPQELAHCNELLMQQRQQILAGDDSVQGFNIGVNQGQVAGQSVFHCHIHLMPRRAGDVDVPRGGVRAIIPGKQTY